MQKVYFLSTCDTCKRVMNEIEIPSSFIKQDLKIHQINEDQLTELFNLTGNYESLFSRRAKLFQERDLKNQDLLEEDYKNLLLEHYTFLKRPVIVNNDEIFIGSSAKSVSAAKKSIHSN